MEELPFNSPVSEARAESLLALLNVGPKDRAIDVGCGRGAMLQMLARNSGCAGLGVDLKEEEINVARRSLLEFYDRLAWRVSSIAELTVGDPFDAVICVGSSSAFGNGRSAFRSALEGTRRFSRLGARVLLGDAIWKQEPATPYLNATGIRADELSTHDDNLSCINDEGHKLICAEVSSQEEFDRFERGFLSRAEDNARGKPHDSDAQSKLTKRRQWYQAYEQWGRDTMGFGLYVVEFSS